MFVATGVAGRDCTSRAYGGFTIISGLVPGELLFGFILSYAGVISSDWGVLTVYVLLSTMTNHIIDRCLLI